MKRRQHPTPLGRSPAGRPPLALLGALVTAFATSPALAQTSVTYGRITAVNTVTVDSNSARTGGAVVGGTVGLVSGRNRSGSNQALRGTYGALAGRRIGGAMGSTQAFEYTILLDGTRTMTMITDQGGKRVGDCVAVEQGHFNNLRLADDARCNARTAGPAPTPPASATRDAQACDQAKDQLLAANTDDEFDRAERRVRLLCGT
jgi:outer membrane lipoprotein SlyB